MPIEIGALHIDGCVRLHGRELRLRPAEVRLLTRLASEPIRVHTRESLVGELGLGEQAVHQHVSRLRREIGPRALVTVRRVGYRLDPDALR